MSDEKIAQTIYLSKGIMSLLKDYSEETGYRNSEIIENALSILFKTRDEVGESVDADFNLASNFAEQKKLLIKIYDLVAEEKSQLQKRRTDLAKQFAEREKRNTIMND